MGMVIVRKIGPGKVKFVHQLGQDGKPYAEDVTVESDVPGRMDYLESKDGKVGTLSFGFSEATGDHSDLKFPEEKTDA